MEGTSGAAERVSLRGAAREAALAPVVIAKAVSFPGGLASSSGYQREPRELHAGPVGRPVQIGCPVGLAQAGSPGGLDMGTRHHVCARRSWPLQPASRRASRQQVSEPIGSGRSSCCEQSRREAPGKAKAARPLTRDTSAGSFDGAAGERAQARAPEAARASHSIRCPDEGRHRGRGPVSAGARSRRRGVVFQRRS
jgi:hypothetical protein